MSTRHVVYITAIVAAAAVLIALILTGSVPGGRIVELLGTLAGAIGWSELRRDPPKRKQKGPAPSGFVTVPVLGVLALVASAATVAGGCGGPVQKAEPIELQVKPVADESPAHAKLRFEGEEVWRSDARSTKGTQIPLVCPPGKVPGWLEGTVTTIECGAGECRVGDLTCEPADDADDGGGEPPDPKDTAQPPAGPEQVARPPAEGAGAGRATPGRVARRGGPRR